MIYRSVARRYAKALISIAKDQKKIDKIQSDLESFLDAFNESKDLQTLFHTPKATVESKKIITKNICEKINTTNLFSNFLSLLIEKQRVEILKDVYEIYSQLANQELGKETVIVTVAEEISASVEADLKQALDSYTQKDVAVTINIDPSILGGVVTKIGSIVIDGSIKNRLNSMRQTIINR